MLWNFSGWMNALGLKRADQPELIYGVQPVVVMGDQSAQVSPILAPVAWEGGFAAAILARNTALSLSSKSGGGLFVRQVVVSSTAVTACRFRIVEGPGETMLNLVATVVQNMAPDPVVSTVQFGTVAAAPTSVFPSFEVLGSGDSILVDPFYVREGFTVELVIQTQNLSATMSILWEELPAAAPTA